MCHARERSALANVDDPVLPLLERVAGDIEAELLLLLPERLASLHGATRASGVGSAAGAWSRAPAAEATPESEQLRLPGGLVRGRSFCPALTACSIVATIAARFTRPCTESNAPP
jgi:hypothetical protein